MYKNHPKPTSFSIVIPVYNEEKYLTDCLESIARQTITPKEIIIVDNNSSDKSVAIAKRYPLIKVIKESEQGIVFARNAGFAAASGDIIVKLDADTRLADTFLEVYLQHFQDDSVAALSNRVGTYQAGLRSLNSEAMNTLTFSFNRLISGHNMLLGSNFAITRLAWQRIEPHVHNRTDIWEDLDVACTITARGMYVAHERAKLAEISVRAADTSLSVVLQRLLGWPRTYWSHNKFAAGLSLISVFFGFLVVVAIKPFASKNYKKP